MIAPGTVHGFRYAPETVGHQVTIPTATLKQCLHGAERIGSLFAESFALGCRGLAAEEARRLLAYTPQSVAEVGQALGFADPAYFSRFFARVVGESPTRYRESVVNGVKMRAEGC